MSSASVVASRKWIGFVSLIFASVIAVLLSRDLTYRTIGRLLGHRSWAFQFAFSMSICRQVDWRLGDDDR
jgi:hypothetical protein